MIKTVSAVVETRSQAWAKTDHRCPRCGKQEVWRLESPTPAATLKHLCAVQRCGARFLLSAAVETAPDEAAQTVAKALREPEQKQ